MKSCAFIEQITGTICLLLKKENDIFLIRSKKYDSCFYYIIFITTCYIQWLTYIKWTFFVSE